MRLTLPSVMTGAMCAIGVFAASAAPAQLPEATGKAETIRLCGTCHDPLRAASVRLTREGWQDVIAKMVTLGMKGTDEELTRVLEYLAEHFKGDAPRPLNLNTATSVELESVAGLLRSESAAWIAHRTKAGPCASLDDFKKVPGVPFKKIDDRRDRLVCFAAVTVPPPAQGGGAPQTPPGGRGRGTQPATFPAQQRPLAPSEVIAKGKGHYDAYCRVCHGPDLRGGDQGGPNLLRSPVALKDVDGESIGPVIVSGRQNPGMPVMPPLPLADDVLKAIAAYVRSVLAAASRQGGPPPGPPVVLNVVVGDAAAGQQYFAAKCSACHSPDTDLKGVATRVTDGMQLQNLWVSGGGGGGRGGRGGRGAAPATSGTPATPSRSRDVVAIVTTPGGERVEGRLVRRDDFIIVLADAEGLQRSFRRDGDVPKVEIRDPLEGHKKLLPAYTNKDIHDVTAYLATLK